MSMLHTVNRSPFETNALTSCLNHALDGAAVLLHEDGVYGALAGATTETLVSVAAGRLSMYVLMPDLRARGIAVERLVSGIKPVDYGDFVDLASTHDKVQSWQ